MIRLLSLLSLLSMGILACRCAAGEAASLADARRAYVFVGGGSGVVVSAEGWVLTNHHVIASMESMELRFPEGATTPAEILGDDPVGDLALLRFVPAQGQPASWAGLAAAGSPAPAEEVWAVGNPFGLGDFDDIPSLSRGVVAAVHLVREGYSDAIMHDAPVNPGNSGGPLFDAGGRLLGINGQIRSVSGFRVNSRIGLAISADTIRAFLPALAAGQGGWIHRAGAPRGLQLRDGPDGVTVGEAGASGLQAGDVILAVDGRAAASAEQAIWLCADRPWRPGSQLAIRLRRGAGELELAIPAGRTAIPGRAWHGWRLAEAPGNPRVALIEAGSPAARAGMRDGDLILAVDGVDMPDRISLLRAMAPKEPGDQIALRLRGRDGVERQVAFQLRAR